MSTGVVIMWALVAGWILWSIYIFSPGRRDGVQDRGSPISCVGCRELPRHYDWSTVCKIHREELVSTSFDSRWGPLGPAKPVIEPASKMEVIRMHKHLDVKNNSDGKGMLGS